MISSVSSSGPLSLCKPDTASVSQKLFARIDQDGDGKINSDEFTAAMEKRLGRGNAAKATQQGPDFEKVFADLDTDADGKINQDEFQTGMIRLREQLRGRPHHFEGRPDPAKIFQEADTDASGKVNATELQQHFEQTVAANRPGAPAPDSSRLVEKLDRDGDGELSESEFTKPPARRWSGLVASLDAKEVFSSIDGDGQITLAELQAHLDAKRTETSTATGEAGDTPATAATTTPDFSSLFASFDEDADGKLAQSELAAMLDQARALADLTPHARAYGADGGARFARAAVFRIDTQA